MTETATKLHKSPDETERAWSRSLLQMGYSDSDFATLNLTDTLAVIDDDDDDSSSNNNNKLTDISIAA